MNIYSHNKKGFTLIEVIITIVLASLVGLTIFTFLGNVLTRSHEPIGNVIELGEAIADMEEAVKKFQDYLTDSAVSWTDFKNFLATEAPASMSYDNRRNQGDFGDDFDVFEVTVTRGNQTLNTLFTQ
jgi:prepilin-type N-terminal cleavage/methylation domain-containing protein